MRLASRLAVVPAVAVGVALAALPASAATTVYSARCTSNIGYCTGSFTHHVAGTVTVRVTKELHSGRTFTWTLTASGRTVCSGTVTAGAGPSVKSCLAVPGGVVTFSVPAADGPTDVTIAA